MDLEGGPEGLLRVDGIVALRFPDPQGRKDRAGRVIPHEFVVLGELALSIDSVEVGRDKVWPLVEDEFSRVWKLREPPSTHE